MRASSNAQIVPTSKPLPFLQAKQSLIESVEEQGVHLKQLLLNSDLRKVSHIAATAKDSAYPLDTKLKEELRKSHTNIQS